MNFHVVEGDEEEWNQENKDRSSGKAFFSHLYISSSVRCRMTQRAEKAIIVEMDPLV